MDEAETADAVLEAEAMRLADLLSALPEPDPQNQTKPEPGDWIKGETVPEAEESGFVFPWELPEPPPAKTSAQPAPAEVEPPEATKPAAPAGIETPPLAPLRPLSSRLCLPRPPQDRPDR